MCKYLDNYFAEKVHFLVLFPVFLYNMPHFAKSQLAKHTKKHPHVGAPFSSSS